SEIGDGAVRLEQERKRTMMGGKVVGEASSVFCGLRLNARERTFGLGFHGTESLAVQIKQVIGKPEARLHGELANSDTAAGGQVEVVSVLHEPARRRKFGVDLATRYLLRYFGHRKGLSGTITEQV